MQDKYLFEEDEYIEDERGSILSAIDSLTHTYIQDGEEIETKPWFCMLSAITDNYGFEDKEAIDLVLKNGYSVIRISPIGSFEGGIAVVADGTSLEDIKSAIKNSVADEFEDTDIPEVEIKELDKAEKKESVIKESTYKDCKIIFQEGYNKVTNIKGYYNVFDENNKLLGSTSTLDSAKELIECRVVEEWSEVAKEDLEKLNATLDSIGFKVVSTRDYSLGKIPMVHYQILTKEGNQTEESFNKMIDLLDKTLEEFEDETGYVTTFNMGLQDDGFISCGFDVEGNYYEPGKDVMIKKPTKIAFKNGEPASDYDKMQLDAIGDKMGIKNVADYMPVDKPMKKEDISIVDEDVEHYYNYDVLCHEYFRDGVISEDEEAYAKSYEDLCKQVRASFEDDYGLSLEEVEEYRPIEVKVNYSDDPKFKKDESLNEDKSDKTRLNYLYNKEKVCPLDKDEMFELQDLIQKYGKPEEVNEEIKKQADVEYKGFTIVHFPYTLQYKGEEHDIEGYIINSPYYLKSNEDKEKSYLPLYCEDEKGEEINFKTLDSAKAYIDNYMVTKKGKVVIKHGNEVHFELNDKVEESVDSKVVKDLIKDEEEAIDGYDKAKDVTDDEHAKEVFDHIKKEEEEHIEELSDLKEEQEYPKTFECEGDTISTELTPEEQELKDKIKSIVNKYEDESTSRIHLFDDANFPFGIHRLDDEEKEYLGDMPNHFVFTITGGLNGSGKWEDYFKDISSVFSELEKEFDSEPWVIKIDADCPDDVWTLQMGIYLSSEKETLKHESLEESLKPLKCKIEKLNKQKINEAPEKHDTLNPLLWNTEDNTLKPEVDEKIHAIVDDFLKSLEEDEIKFNLEDIKLVGSNCSYNYNDKSDLDIHLVMDTDSLECPENLFPLIYSAYRSIYNKNHDIDFYGISVEIFVETSDTEQMSEPTEEVTEARKTTALKSNGIYSVMNKKWIKEPVAEDIPELDEEAFNKLLDEWKAKLEEIKAEPTIEKIEKFIEDIYDLRKTSIAEEGEYGTGNLVFKEIRNLGELDNLKELKHELEDKALSLPDDKSVKLPAEEENKDKEVIVAESLKSVKMIESLKSNTPYMLDREGNLLECGTVHPYILMYPEASYEKNLKELLEVHTDFIPWFKEHCKTPETLELLDKFVALEDKSTDEAKEMFTKLNELTNQEFCRVRTSNIKYAFGGENGEIYFRISSENFNWFDLIWKTVVSEKSDIKFVTVVKDKPIVGTKQEYYVVKGKELKHLPVEEFITLNGNPVIEEMNKNNTKEVFKAFDAKVDELNVILASDTDGRKIENQEEYDKAKEFIESGIESVGMWDNKEQPHSYIIKCDLSKAKELAKALCQREFITVLFKSEDEVTAQVYSTVDDEYSNYEAVEGNNSSKVIVGEKAKELPGYTVIGDLVFSFGIYDTESNKVFKDLTEDNNNDKIIKEEVNNMFDEMKKLAEELTAHFASKDCHYEIWPEEDGISAQIDWGDWKHDHLFFDIEAEKFLAEKGYLVTSSATEVTEEDGSDCYSACHSLILRKAE